MARLVSRVALVVTISYAALIAVLLLATWHFAEPEAAANVATVYVFVFALDRALSRNSTSS
jgi:hypothetical protein